MKKTKLAITGASGFVGSIIRNSLGEKFNIIELGRRPSSPKVEFRNFTLGKEPNPNIFSDVNVLVHAAWDFSLTKWEDVKKINSLGSISLLRAAKAAGVKRIIFISTLSSFDGCVSSYGKAKFFVEKEAKKIGAAIIRPGLVFGKNAGGIIGALNRLIVISPVIPIIGSGRQPFYVCYKESLGELVLKLCSAKTIPKSPITAANETPLDLKQILSILALAKRKKPICLSIPSVFVMFWLKTFEMVGITIGLRSDSLVSLMNLPKSVDFTTTRKIGVKFEKMTVQTLNS